MFIVSRFIRNYLNTGTKASNSPAVRQQIQVTNLFGFIGYFITFILGVAALFRSQWVHNGDFYLGVTLLIASVLFFTSRIILKYFQSKNGYKFSANLVTSALMLLMLYLIVMGGVKNTGPLWIYIVPPVVLFFGGLKRGLIQLGIFALVVILILEFPNNGLLFAEYSNEFRSRLIYSFITVSMLFVFYEYSRQRSFKTQQELSKKFEQQARIDSLSGLQNRRGMLEKLEYEHQRTLRHSKNMTLMMCDIDHFKQVNDKYGHDVGDIVIKQVGQMFANGLRKQDTVARWGGEEFLFMLPETSQQQAFLLAEKLRKKIESYEQKVDSTHLSVTVSIGIYQMHPQDKLDHAISRADTNLYRAKTHGRNCTVVTD
ncbi:diguanylate cyclase [Paraglaciecola chathamensis]|uniref:diguanylate cyclase n=1 Tax=Paraglaciecola chathamensis TaxID=368405 RepID=A0A8H9M0Q0_9ALTE|nr:diguanylate cyclase [Paraglaciecola oceanifecundans]GGZ60913.1 GGDEF domain-containing protein [Paraglaciecola oceanifecundans]